MLRYTREEKPLWATICFSIKHVRPCVTYVKSSNEITPSRFARNIRDFQIQKRNGNKNIKKKQNNRLNKQITTLYVHYTFIFIFFAFFTQLWCENT